VSLAGQSENFSGDSSSGRWFFRRPLRWIRRAHLYLGLCLLPWTLLYAITAILFNHPGVFSDVPLVTFGPEATRGTALEGPLDPGALAVQVVGELNRLQHPTAPYQLTPDTRARFNREFAFATVANEQLAIGVLVDVANGGGTIRVAPKPIQVDSRPAPFAVGPGVRPPIQPAPAGAGEKRGLPEKSRATRLMLENPFHERMKAALPSLLARNGFPSGEVTVTSVPDLVFEMQAEGEPWTVTYNAMTGAVSGKPGRAVDEPISVRQFLLRLHTAHGFPGSIGPRWFWAIVVDGMAIVLVFWCASGLVMWWQIKSTRIPGSCLLLLSSAAAVLMAVGMYAGMS
jgi:hypothetical protein